MRRQKKQLKILHKAAFYFLKNYKTNENNSVCSSLDLFLFYLCSRTKWFPVSWRTDYYKLSTVIMLHVLCSICFGSLSISFAFVQVPHQRWYENDKLLSVSTDKERKRFYKLFTFETNNALRYFVHVYNYISWFSIIRTESFTNRKKKKNISTKTNVSFSDINSSLIPGIAPITECDGVCFVLYPQRVRSCSRKVKSFSHVTICIHQSRSNCTPSENTLIPSHSKVLIQFNAACMAWNIVQFC